MEVFALKDDVEARGVKASYPLLDYEGMLRLIFESDKVITW
ncbi:MAG TPA: DsrH/TusB family sulfur metabolism protein [Candidatus Hypogeohydataceae bacterium YC40]